MRISELLDLHYQDLDLNEGRINIRRLKNGFSTVHPLRFDEREAVERWTRERANWKGADRTDAIFISRRGVGFRQQAYRIIRDAGIEAGTVTQTHPHMLRHACGYELAGAWCRYPFNSGLSRASKYSPYCALYRQ